jgi:ATP synthase subunit 6
MIVRLFSIFDPSISFFRSRWLPMILSVFIVGSSSFKMLPGNQLFIVYYIHIFNLMTGGFKVSKLPLFIWLSCVFSYVVVVNVMSLFPHRFSRNRQVSLVFPLSLSLWLSFILFNLSKRFFNFVKKLTPQGRPIPIMNFIVLVELVSILIRPITLSIRLVSNIVAGHLLISILVNFLLSSGYYRFFTIVVIMNLLEIGVSFIQGYVFSMLLFMYYFDE